MAAFTSDSGAGSAMVCPPVVMAWKPNSSNSVPTKMYTPAPKMYAPRNLLRCGLLPLAIPSNSPTAVSSAICSFPGTILNRGMTNTRSSIAASSSAPTTTSEDMYAGFTSFSPNRLMRFVPWSTASRMASCTDSDFPCPGTSREPARNAAVISSHTTMNLIFFFFSIRLSPFTSGKIFVPCRVVKRQKRHGADPALPISCRNLNVRYRHLDTSFLL